MHSNHQRTHDTNSHDTNGHATTSEDTHTSGSVEVLATYTEREQAQAAVATLRPRFDELSVPELELGGQTDALDAMAINQRMELNDSVGALSGPMLRGALVWGVAGLIAGAVLALPVLLFLDWPDDQSAIFVAAIATVGALCLATVGVIVGGSRQAQKEGEFTPENPWAVVRVRVAESEEWQVRAALVDTGARSVRRVGSSTHATDRHDVETPRGSVGLPARDDWPASQRGARTT